MSSLETTRLFPPFVVFFVELDLGSFVFLHCFCWTSRGWMFGLGYCIVKVYGMIKRNRLL
jgi:hypothetical protein